MGRSTEGRLGLSEHRKYRTFTAQQKLEIVLVGLRGDRSVTEVLADPTTYYVIIGTAKYPNGAIGGPLHRA